MTAASTGAAYDARCEEYVQLVGHVEDLAAADRALVSRWRDSTTGPVLDAGCGPGAWVGTLAAGGRQVVGVDVSRRFLGVARQTRPTVPFLRASLGALPLRTGSVGGVLAWYSVVHTVPEALPGLLGELGRVLAPRGSLLLGFFDGDPGQPFAHAVTTAFHWTAEALTPALAAAGLEVVERHHRHDDGHRPHAALVARRG